MGWRGMCWRWIQEGIPITYLRFTLYFICDDLSCSSFTVMMLSLSFYPPKSGHSYSQTMKPYYYPIYWSMYLTSTHLPSSDNLEIESTFVTTQQRSITTPTNIKSKISVGWAWVIHYLAIYLCDSLLTGFCLLFCVSEDHYFKGGIVFFSFFSFKMQLPSHCCIVKGYRRIGSL